jgi:PAS domain S-box-containing protein
MHPFAFAPLIGCVLCTAYCMAVWLGVSDLEERRRRRLTRVLFGLFAAYAGCEAAWNLLGDPVAGLPYLHASTAVLLAIGPMAVITTLRLALRPHRLAKRGAVAVTLAAIGFLVLEQATGWMYQGLEVTAWGVNPIPGPLYPLVYVFVLSCGAVAYFIFKEAVGDSPQFEPGPGGFFILVGIGAAVLATCLTDAVLPVMGIPAPRLASLALGLLAVSVVWTMNQSGGQSVVATPSLISEHILHSLNEGVAFVDLEGRVLLANEGLGHLMGTDSQMLVGASFSEHLPSLDLTRAQERIDIECELQTTYRSKILVAASLSTVRDQRGEALGLVVVLRDVRELKVLRNRLATSGRLAAVGQMAAGIAHEINNPISFVRTNLGVLREHWQAVETAFKSSRLDPVLEEVLKDGEELIAESVEGIDRAAAIVRDVRELSHAGSGGCLNANLNELLDRVIRLVSPQIGPNVTIDRRFDEDCRAEIRPDQISQVFINLLTNAVHAVGDEGRILIETSRGDDHVEIRISDNGCGIPANDRDRIFDPFYTTKEVGVGTGLGLSISHEIVRGHGGELLLLNGSDPGSTFCVRLAALPRQDQ